MQELIPFNFKDKEIRVVIDEITGEPLWVAKDVCDVLQYKDSEVTLRKLDSDEKLTRKIYGSGQNRNMTCINESGLYTLILRSNKPEAKKFKKWVTSEVLPSIRKTGSYQAANVYEIKEIRSIDLARIHGRIGGLSSAKKKYTRKIAQLEKQLADLGEYSQLVYLINNYTPPIYRTMLTESLNQIKDIVEGNITISDDREMDLMKLIDQGVKYDRLRRQYEILENKYNKLLSKTKSFLGA